MRLRERCESSGDVRGNGKIRDRNVVMLAAARRQFGEHCTKLIGVAGHQRDGCAQLREFDRTGFANTLRGAANQRTFAIK